MKMKAIILAGLLGSTMFASAALAADTTKVPLVTAARQGDREAVRSLLNGIPQKVIAGPEGAAALVWAVSHNDPEMVDLLVRAGADVKAANDFGATPLYAAAANPDSALVKKFLAAGADANAALLSGETPLMEAAYRGNLDTVRALLAAKADPNAKETKGGQTALMWAVQQGQTPIVQELVRAGADVNEASKTGFTPLMFAAQHGEIGDAGDVDAARILVSAGAQVNAVEPNSKLTPLIVASGMVHTKVVELLLDNGADPNHVEQIGYTALAWVVRDGTYGIDYANKDKVVDIVKLLLKHGADPNFRMMNPKSRTSTDISLTGATPLVLAAETNNTAAVKALMEGGADPKATTVQGTNAAMMAAGAAVSVQHMRNPEERAMAVDTVRLLIEQGGVDVNAVGQYGWTALHAATYQGMTDVMSYLISKGADVNQMDVFGQTPLSISLAVLTQDIGARRPLIPRRYRKEVAELLLKAGATPLDKSGVVVVLQRTGDETLGRENANEEQ
ncbi:MAG TPA: ankyrin repeat domain-containing protein [Xanthobacteraceae bacterium]|jgi:ankyrin repeat protein